MRRYYIYQKTKKAILIENEYCFYNSFVWKEMPWECLGYIDGAKDLYDYLRRCTKGFGRKYVFADSFSCVLDNNTYAAYLVVDDKDKIRDFWEIARPFEEKRDRIWEALYPEKYSFRRNPVPGIHKPSHWLGKSAPSQMREFKDMPSQRDTNNLKAEYPDASIHIYRAKRKKRWTDLRDIDFWPIPQKNKNWKAYKKASRQWDKSKNTAGLYVAKRNNRKYAEEEENKYA